MFAQRVPNGCLDVARRIILINRRWAGGGSREEVRKVLESHVC